MTKYLYFKRIAGLAGVSAIVALAISAPISQATKVCPPGVKPPSPYCRNVKPVATTEPATDITKTSAVLHGVTGPGVQHGDTTRYRFQYGRTTAYGTNTAVHTAPAGSAVYVSQKIGGLKPGTTYHFRIVSANADGQTKGKDRTFTTKK